MLPVFKPKTCRISSLMSVQLIVFHAHSLSTNVQFGGWSSQGLHLSGSWGDGSTHVVCESTHLTCFAMLVDYSGVVAVSCPPCCASLHTVKLEMLVLLN